MITVRSLECFPRGNVHLFVEHVLPFALYLLITTFLEEYTLAYAFIICFYI